MKESPNLPIACPDKMMMSKQVSIEEALSLISSGTFDSTITVVFDEGRGVEAIEAVQLGSVGIDVPEGLIYYDEDSIQEDRDFDGPWETIESEIEEEEKYCKLEMKVNQEGRAWIDSNNIDLNALVQKLLEDAYKTSKLVEK